MERIPSIQDSWLNGLPRNADVFTPIALARLELEGWREEQVRALWKKLEIIFYQWKVEHGEKPPLRRRHDAKPWECGGDRVNDYVDLLLERLIPENYPPVEKLLRKTPVSKLLAVMILAEAASDDSSGLGLPRVGARPPKRYVQAALKAALRLLLEMQKKELSVAIFKIVAELYRLLKPDLGTGRKARKTLDDARMESAKARRERKQENEAAWRKKARKDWPEHPGWTVDEMAASLWQQWDEVGPPDDPKKVSTIKKAIKGVKSTIFKRRTKSSLQ